MASPPRHGQQLNNATLTALALHANTARRSPYPLMRGGRSRAIMSLAFASRRGLSLMIPFPTMLVRSRPAFTPSVPAAVPQQSSRVVLARTTWSNTCENHHAVQVAAQLRVLVAPLSMAAARSGTGGGSPKKSAGSSNKRKPRHVSSSATSSPGGAKRRLSSDPEGGSAASPRTVPWGTGAAEGVGGRGRGQASAGGRGAAVSAGAGRGGRGTIARGDAAVVIMCCFGSTLNSVVYPDLK